jgi:hypothetical protein
MTPHISDVAFVWTVAFSFLAVCVSLLLRTVGLWALRVAFGVIYFLSTYHNLSFGIQMAHAFNSSDTSGGAIRFVYFPFLFIYYGFAVVTCFIKPPSARWFVPLVAVTTPIVAFWQQSGMFATGMLAYRALHAFCFVLVWFRIYDMQRQKTQPNTALEPTPTAP